MKQVPHSRVFDYNRRIASGVSMLSTASVVVTDRLHCSILAFLMTKPHIILDYSYKKLTRTREVAFQTSEACRQRRILQYDDAPNLKEAVEKAINLVEGASQRRLSTN